MIAINKEAIADGAGLLDEHLSGVVICASSTGLPVDDMGVVAACLVVFRLVEIFDECTTLGNRLRVTSLAEVTVIVGVLEPGGLLCWYIQREVHARIVAGELFLLDANRQGHRRGMRLKST
ncbi:hypothetical protein H7347_00855 [Corynebacterium sp. zg-331]|uniref:hypothetical protein n=1 Tax=unclassified Corynebacterium TaxID=2624378 RepID=UPI00128AE325|nr:MULTISPECIES: hypothetical protein [unclassified Corynebacterium]MBC3185141.1 hypothetical protein [Corynebacterium sp. zg-331]MPV51639.1 hypothetical protein [Corynebacterium sp. zg331]